MKEQQEDTVLKSPILNIIPIQNSKLDSKMESSSESTSKNTLLFSTLKILAALAFFTNAISTLSQSSPSTTTTTTTTTNNNNQNIPPTQQSHRRLTSTTSTTSTTTTTTPSHITPLLNELSTREDLFRNTPPEEIKYWFEYTGPLQKYYYRYSKSRGKADSFEGRDDSGVTSARFVNLPGGGPDYAPLLQKKKGDLMEVENDENKRLYNNCLSMGAPTRSNMSGDSIWKLWYNQDSTEHLERCRLLMVVNTVGAGKGATLLWETTPPGLEEAGPPVWQSEQATAAMHLERNLKEMDAMCKSNQVAVRVQMLVCEPIPGVWTDWMDSMLPHCGGKPMLVGTEQGGEEEEVEERPSPLQVVVVASADTADTCHDLKSGFMEKRMQDLILTPPYVGASGTEGEFSFENFQPHVKTTHPDLISSDDFDLYVAMKWSSLVTLRTVSSFLQSSADLEAAATRTATSTSTTTTDSIYSSTLQSYTSSTNPISPLLIPSFIRVSYVSEENNKVAKWRMHGDFFHPAAWEISKDSYDMTWIPHSLSSSKGVSPACTSKPDTCGQWWITMTEEQMPTTPEMYANDATPPLIRGGSNFIWMLTEHQRQTLVTKKVCDVVRSQGGNSMECGPEPQAVIPLGDLQSHMVNFMPNTALGKKHDLHRRPGYSKGDQLEHEREKVRERKQLKGQEDIEKALFDYTIYPVALFHKDATIQAVRLRDSQFPKKEEEKEAEARVGPNSIMSGYYDVTISKPREPLPSWCQHVARRGLCSLYADYFRESEDKRCWEACGMLLDWKPIEE